MHNALGRKMGERSGHARSVEVVGGIGETLGRLETAFTLQQTMQWRVELTRKVGTASCFGSGSAWRGCGDRGMWRLRHESSRHKNHSARPITQLVYQRGTLRGMPESCTGKGGAARNGVAHRRLSNSQVHSMATFKLPEPIPTSCLAPSAASQAPSAGRSTRRRCDSASTRRRRRP